MKHKPPHRLQTAPPPKRTCNAVLVLSDNTTVEERKREREIAKLKEEIDVLKQEKVARFGVRRFIGSDTEGLPTYKIVLCLYNFVTPLLPHLHLMRSDVPLRGNSQPLCKSTSRSHVLHPIDDINKTPFIITPTGFSSSVSCRIMVQCSPCKSNPDTTKFLLIRRFLESRHTKNSNGMSCIIGSRVSLVYVHTRTREYQGFLITCVRLRYLRRPRSWG